MKIHFESMSEFYDWKIAVEIDTKSLFVKAKYSTTLSLHYLCHRSGKFKSTGHNKRRLKFMG